MDQRWADLYAAVARRAIHDLHSGYTHPRHMDAGAWLEAAGLLEQAQTNGPIRRAGRTRRSIFMTHDSSPTAVTTHLIQALGEREPMAKRKLGEIVRTLGTETALQLLAETQRIEADGGMLTIAGDRRRTPGGVYMKLVKERVSPEVRKKLFPYPRKAASKPVPAAVAQETPEPSASVLPAPEPLKPAKQPKPKAAPEQAATPDARPCAACEQPAAVVGKFHFTRAGKQCLCAPCADLGFVFGPSGDVLRLQEQAV